MNAAASETTRFSVKWSQIRITARNQKTVAAAEAVAASRLMRGAISSGTHPVNRSHAFPNMTKNGFPGGCGRPTMWAVAMYSEVSHQAVVGPRVRT